MSDKAFDATPSRLARAKRDGDSPRSADLTAVVSTACAALAAGASLQGIAGAAQIALENAAHGRAGLWPYVAVAVDAAAVPAAALAGALTTTYVQTRSLSFKFPEVKLERLNPFSGLRRMLSRDGVLAASKAVVVAAAVTACVFPALRGTFEASAGGASTAALAALARAAFANVLVGALGVAVVFALVDTVVERHKWRRRLKMSFDELKRDHKANEGDPLQKGRRRQSHRALVRGSIARLRDAAFVVVNPTHVAVALEYAPPAVAVPRVLVRAVDEGAREVKRRARALGIPIVENVALARSLLATTEAGDFIPPGAYAAVAAVVASLARA